MDIQPTTTPLTPEQADLRELRARLARVLAVLQDPLKSTEGQVRGRQNYRYADLADCLKAVRPLLSAEGLALCQPMRVDDDVLTVATQVSYGLAQESSQLSAPAAKTMQDLGAQVTYLRRYTLCALLAVQGDEADPDREPRSEPRSEPRKDEIREKAQSRVAEREPGPAPMADDELRAAAKALQSWAQERGVRIPAKGVLSRLFELKGWDVMSREHHALWTAALADPRAEAKILDALRQIAPAPAAPAQPPAPQMQREATALDAEKAMIAFARAQGWPTDHHHIVSALALLAADLGQNAEYPSPRDRGVQVAKLTDPKQVEILRATLADAFPPF